MDLSGHEVATLLDVSVRTVRARLQRGELPGRKVHGSWRVQRQDVPLTEDQLLDVASSNAWLTRVDCA